MQSIVWPRKTVYHPPAKVIAIIKGDPGEVVSVDVQEHWPRLHWPLQVKLDEKGQGSFEFPLTRWTSNRLTVRINGRNDKNFTVKQPTIVAGRNLAYGGILDSAMHKGDGEFYAMVYPRFKQGFSCLDAEAFVSDPPPWEKGQLLTEVLIAYQHTGHPRYKKLAEKLASHLVGLQIRDKSNPAYGGVHPCVYDISNVTYAWFLAYRLLGIQECLDSAMLVVNEHFPAGFERENGEFTGCVATKVGDAPGNKSTPIHIPLLCLYGFLPAYQVTGDSKYLDWSCKIADWTLRYGIETNDELTNNMAISFIQYKDYGTQSDLWSWPRRKKLIRWQMYLMYMLTWLYTVSGDARYIDGAKAIADATMRWQRPDGSFPENILRELVMPRTSYAESGYIAGKYHLLYKVTGTERYEAIASKAARHCKWLQHRWTQDNDMLGLFMKGDHLFWDDRGIRFPPSGSSELGAHSYHLCGLNMFLDDDLHDFGVLAV